MAFQITTFAHGGKQVASGFTVSSSAFNAVAGNCLIVAVSMYNPSELPQIPTDTAGNTYSLIGSAPATPATLDGTPNIWFYKSNNILGNVSNVVTSSVLVQQPNFWEIVVWQISGAAAGNPVNTFKIGAGASASNAQTTAALTTTVANTIVLAYGSLSNTGATYTPGTGYTLDMGTSDDGGLSGCEHQQFTSIQTGIVPAITATDSTHNWQMMAVAIAGAGSGAYSQPDCRAVTAITPNSSRTVQGTKIYDVPKVDSRVSGAPVDCRIAPNIPVDSRVAPNIPQNSRTPGTFGPGE